MVVPDQIISRINVTPEVRLHYGYHHIKYIAQVTTILFHMKTYSMNPNISAELFFSNVNRWGSVGLYIALIFMPIISARLLHMFIAPRGLAIRLLHMFITPCGLAIRLLHMFIPPCGLAIGI